MLTAVLLGLALGVRHAFDPDHVVAITAITSRHRSSWTASWIGASWGLGHSATVFAVGVAIIALRIAIPEALADLLELVVGVVLVGLGIANLIAARPNEAGGSLAAASRASLRATLARSGLVGLVHGLAGSAAVVLLALAAMPTPEAALVYLLVFGSGTVIGMIVFSSLVSVPLGALGRSEHAHRFVTAGTGMVSLVFGGFILFEFGSHAVWPALG